MHPFGRGGAFSELSVKITKENNPGVGLHRPKKLPKTDQKHPKNYPKAQPSICVEKNDTRLLLY